MKRGAGHHDVVVVGFGAAGACAAIAAAESGASVLVVDRGLGGGASALSGGIVYAGGGTRYQVEAGQTDSPDNMFAYLREELQGVVDDDTLRRFCDGSVEQLEWLERHGARFGSSLCDYKTSYPTDRHYLYYSGNEKAHPYRAMADPAPRGHRQIALGMQSGRVLWEVLRDAAVKLGVEFMPMTRADELIVEDGRVTGVRCRTMADGGTRADDRRRRVVAVNTKLANWFPGVGRVLDSYIEKQWRGRSRPLRLDASSVILAAGGFAFNRDMLCRHAPGHAMISPLGTAGDDGTGIALGESAGGVSAHLDRVTAWRFMSPPSAMAEGVVVGINGERIANEDLYGATFSDVMIRKFGGSGYLIVDSAVWKRAIAQIPRQTLAFQKAWLAVSTYTHYKKADSLAVLADKLKISASGLIATVNAYNDAIVAGAEDPMHKASEFCTPLVEPPFYGVDVSLKDSPLDFVPGLTLGGLRVASATGLVLSADGTPVSGLYAAGRNAVGVCSNSYVSGLSLADCVFSGRRAGQAAAHAAVTDRALQPPGVAF